MTVYLAGSGPFIFPQPLVFPSGMSLVEATSAQVDHAWVTTAFEVHASAANDIRQPTIPFEPVLEGWVHFEMFTVSTARNQGTPISLANAAGTDCVDITAGSARVWNGTAWITVASVPGKTTNEQIDIHFKVAATGFVEFYQDRVLLGRYEGSTTHFGTGITKLLFGRSSTATNSYTRYSQILVADFPTLFAKVKQTLFDANGTHTAWTGDVTNINAAVPTTASPIIAGAGGLKESFKAAARSFVGYNVKAVIPMFAAGRGGPSAPPRFRTLIRKNGVDYYAPDHTLGYGLSEYQDMFELDPETGLPWTIADAAHADLEFGVEAIDD